MKMTIELKKNWKNKLKILILRLISTLCNQNNPLKSKLIKKIMKFQVFYNLKKRKTKTFKNKKNFNK